MSKVNGFIPVLTETEFHGKAGVTTSDCVAITFIVPPGANPVVVNQIPIAAGGSFAIEQSAGYIDRTRYEFVFGTGGSGNELYIVRIIPQMKLNSHE